MVEIKKIAENIWEIPKTGKMNVPGIVFASDKLMEKIKKDKTIEQVKNVAALPGIVGKSIAMSDAHQGYGMPVGGVVAFDCKTGIISPGAVGYDIGSSNLKKDKFMKKIKEVTHQIKRDVPSGVGHGTDIKLSDQEVRDVLEKGVYWALENKYATKEDMAHIESNGKIPNADASKISMKSIGRGRNQLGTLGSGNHFLEIQEVEKIFDKQTATIFGLSEIGQIVVMIHTGSRGFGHQTASDYIQKMEGKYGWKHLPDRELIYAPIESELGRDYSKAMAAAANFAFVNRQMITHRIREAFNRFIPKTKLKVTYDLSHNMAKFEDHIVEGKKTCLCLHRKGSTRSFGPSRASELPKDYAKTGCPIFIPGSMGTYSYVLAGTDKAEEISLSSTAHGAGRVMSRTSAKKNLNLEKVKSDLEKHGVYLEAGSNKGILEEAPEAYKDVNEVVRVSDELGIGKLVARLKPLAVIKA
jgi:tRNA-splicing ligase RtcB